MRRIKVLYIAGWGRSGTTILDRCIGQVQGFVSCGEVRYIWDRGLLENRSCSCGQPFRECGFWSRVAGKYLNSSKAEIEAIVTARDQFRTRLCRKAPLIPDSKWMPSLATYVRHLKYIVGQLHEISGANVLIDSSRFPSHGYALACLGVDLYVLHVVRDPRAVAYSWSRRKIYDTGPDGTRFIERKGPIENAIYGRTWNHIIERLWASGPQGRYLRVRYEDFVSQPRIILNRILTMVGEQGPLDFFKDAHSVRLQPGHLAGGNPTRFRTGLVTLSSDDAWQQKLPASHKLVTTILTFPMLKRYGYDILMHAAESQKTQIPRKS